MDRKQLKRANGFIFALCVLLTGFSSLQAVHIPESNFTTIMQGKAFRQIEDHYQDFFPGKEWFTGFWAVINYQLFGEGRKGVVIGKNEWLFSIEEFQLHPNYQQHWVKNLQQIVTYQKQLKKSNVKLIVMLVPEKTDIYSHMLSKNSRHNDINLYQRSYHELLKQGLDVINLRATMLKEQKTDQQLFFRTDTHWTPHGSAISARMVRDSGFIELGNENYLIERRGVKKLSGDLASFIPTGKALSMFAPRADSLERIKIYKDENETDLFSDTEVDTALVGTSYSMDERWLFVDWLQHYLLKEIINFSKKGKGPFEPMRNFIVNEIAGFEDLTCVIWEIPVRYLLDDQSQLNTGEENTL